MAYFYQYVLQDRTAMQLQNITRRVRLCWAL